MRNLKKILALVLALVMSLSLMATAGAADAAASNSETITAGYQTAVDVLKGVKVFNGYSDGTFKPQQTITRAEVAAILYRIATGDVTDAKKDIYTDMANVNFTDLAGANWAKGYINYCSNAELIVGMGDGTFRPSQPISGYATLAMILRALGYDQNNEFKGSGWELRTASEARRLGILNNVTGDLGSYATREMVAEILFRAILCETVTYSPMNQNGYLETGKTLAKQNLDLEEVEGVVTANEYANLDGTSTLPTDKTQLGDYRIDYHTTLDDIGESRLAYIHKGSTVLSIADTGVNKTEETTEAKKVSDLTSAAGISEAAEETFVNFDKYATRTSDWRIKYVLNSNTGILLDDTLVNVCAKINAAHSKTVASLKPNADAPTSVEVVLTPGTEILKMDLDYIEDIFAGADKTIDGVGNYLDGEVYVGTQSTKDISDDYNYSYEKFKDEFIEEGEIASVSANERGNWVKVIDNDGDGKTDYIFKVVYTVAQIASVKDDTYTLDTTKHTLFDHNQNTTAAAIKVENEFNNVTTQKVVATNGETFEKGDVVYYAVIDGKAQTVKCDTVTAQIEKVDHNKLIATTTDGTEYTESQVCEHIEDEAYESRVRNLAGKVSYELYFDRGGYLAAFVKTDKVGDFQLITDGWYNRQKANDEYAVRVYNDETGKQDIVDITANGSLFVGNSRTLNNDWNALKALGGVDKVLNYSDGENDKIQTTVAAIAADGTILPVENSSVTGRYEHNMLDLMDDGVAKIPTKKAVNGTIYWTHDGARDAYDTQGYYYYNDNGNLVKERDSYEVRALASTVYYVVYKTPNGDIQVVRSVGYANAPDVEKFVKNEWVEDIYAVGTRHQSDNDLGAKTYYTADVVVIELKNYHQAGRLVLVVDDTARFSDVTLRDVQIIDEDGELKTVTVNWQGNVQYNDNRDNHKKIEPGLYYLYNTNDDNIYRLANSKNVSIKLSAEEILKDGRIITGQVEKKNWLYTDKYVVIDEWANNGVNTAPTNKSASLDVSDETPLYTLKYNDSTWREKEPSIDKADDYSPLNGRVNDTYTNGFYRETFEEAGEHNTVYYNYNDVMVFHNTKGAVVYAVSFENIWQDGARKGVDYIEDYAQRLWENVTPAAPAPAKALYVEFYGSAAAIDNTITVPYDAAKAWVDAGGKVLKVEGVEDGWFLVTEDGTIIESKDVENTLKNPATKETTYKLNLKRTDNKEREIWTLIIGDADPDNSLYYNGALVNKTAADPTICTGVVTTLANFKAQFTPAEKNLGVTWQWFDGNGDEVIVQDDDQTNIANGFRATITVTAQNGTPATYYIRFNETGAPLPTEGVELTVALNDELGYATWFWNNPADLTDNTYTEFSAVTSTVKTDVNGKIALADVLTACPPVGDTESASDWKVEVTGTNCTAVFDYASKLITVTEDSENASIVVGMKWTGDRPLVIVPDTPNPNPDPDPNPNPGGGDDDDNPTVDVTPTPGIPDDFGPAKKLGSVLSAAPNADNDIQWTFFLKTGQEVKKVEANGKYDVTNKVTKIGESENPKYEGLTLWQIMLPAGGSYTLKITLKGANDPDTYTFTVTYNAEQADVTVNDKAYTAPVEVEAGSVAFTVAAKEGFEVKSVKNGETVLTGTDGKYTVTVTDADVTITVETAAKSTGDVTVNVKGNAAMEVPAPATGTAEKVSFSIKMKSAMYKPVITKAADADGAEISNNKWNKAENVTVKPTDDGLTWNVTVANAEDGMTLTFGVEVLKKITVAVSSGAGDHGSEISNVTPKDGQYAVNGTDAEYTFTFTVTSNYNPKVNTPPANCDYTLERVGTTNNWKLTVKLSANAADTVTFTLAAADKETATVKIDSTAAVADKKDITLDILNNKASFTVKTNFANRVPVVDAGVKANNGGADTTEWTYKYDEATGTWTITSSETNGKAVTAGSTYTLTTAIQEPATIKPGDGIASIDRTVVYPCEATGTTNSETFTLKVTLKDDFKKGGTDAEKGITWPLQASADGSWAVTIGNKTKITGTITIVAGQETVPTLSGTNNDVLDRNVEGEAKWTDADQTTGTITYTLTMVEPDVAISGIGGTGGSPSTIDDANWKAVRNANDNTWTVTIKRVDTNTAYTVSTTKLHKVTLTTEDEHIGLVGADGSDVKTLTSDFVYDTNAKIKFQFRIDKNMTAEKSIVTATPGIAASAVKITQNVAGSTADYDLYDVEIPNTITKDLEISLAAEASETYKVTINEDTSHASDWNVVDKTVETNTGSASFTVKMADGLFPYVDVASTGIVAKYDPKPVKDGSYNVWTINLSSIAANDTITVKSVDKVSVMTKETKDIGTDFTSSGFTGMEKYLATANNGDNDSLITETIDEDGVHYVTVNGALTGWIDEAWFEAALETAGTNGTPAVQDPVTLTGLFSAATSWNGADDANSIVKQIQGANPKWNIPGMTASKRFAIVALLLPGTAANPAATGVAKISLAVDSVEAMYRYPQTSADTPANDIVYVITYNADLGLGSPATGYTE